MYCEDLSFSRLTAELVMNVARFHGRSKWFYARVGFLAIAFFSIALSSLGSPGKLELEGGAARFTPVLPAAVAFVSFTLFWLLVLKLMVWIGTGLRWPDWDVRCLGEFGETRDAPTQIHFIGVLFWVAGVGLVIRGLIAESSVVVMFAILPAFAGLGTLSAVWLAVRRIPRTAVTEPGEGQ